MLVLDTNVIIHFGKRTNDNLVRRLQEALDSNELVFVSAITIQELEVGALRDRNSQARRKKTGYILSRTNGVLDYTEKDALIAATIQFGLMARGEQIGAYDLLIAAQCIRTDAVLITNNVRHFERVPGLRVVDWAQN